MLVMIGRLDGEGARADRDGKLGYVAGIQEKQARQGLKEKERRLRRGATKGGLGRGW